MISSTPRRVLHLISQAHLDPVWLWPLRDGIAEALTTMQSAVDRCDENPDFVFSRSSTLTYRWAKEMDPRLYGRIQELCAEGRWELLGGWLEQPDCNLPSTESFLRQALYGQRFLQDEFGKQAQIGYVPDSFGHAGGLPQILQQSGLSYYAFMRPSPYDNPDIPLLFWWQSDDGSRVLGQRIPGIYSQSYSATADDIETLIRAADEKNFAPGFDHGVMWFGIGNHGGGPTREHIARVLELQNDPTLPELRFSTLQEYFDAVQTSPALTNIPVIKDELQYIFRGCYSATGEVKALNRQCEKLLCSAESTAVLASMQAGMKFNSSNLQEAWTKLLFNQFHDILAGTCVQSVQAETRHRFGATLDVVNDTLNRATNILARQVDTTGESGSVLFVHNALPWERTAIVQVDTFKAPHGRAPITHLETPDGAKVPLQWLTADANFGPWGLKWGKLTAAVTLPAGGYRTFGVVTEEAVLPDATETEAKETKQVATTQFVKTDKSAGSELQTLGATSAFTSLLTSGGGELLQKALGIVIIEDNSDTWGQNASEFRNVVGEAETVSHEVIEEGSLLSVHRQKLTWGASEFWLDIIRYKHTPQIGVRVRINWQEQRKIAKLEIATRLEESAVVVKSAGGVTSREADGGEAPCQDWIALQGTLDGEKVTLGLLNDGSYSYDCREGVLRMVLARSTPFAEHSPFNYEDISNVAFTDQGWQEHHFWLVVGGDSWQDMALDRLSQEWQTPASLLLDSAHPGVLPREKSMVSLEPVNVSLLALKPAEAGDGFILRVQEASGQATQAAAQIGDSTLHFELKPWQIKSFHFAQENLAAARETDALERPNS
ncbi:MAG TPA: glycoside hydrolase family 38 C-terminal domain-containing protein [Abditibacteriaceae bacterium]|jgi:alpha-mannosidase